MNDSSDPVLRPAAVFVDEVDDVIEFTEDCRDYPRPAPGQHDGSQKPAEAPRPVLVDVVDQLVELTDTGHDVGPARALPATGPSELPLPETK
jgi:hypothetical protein